MQKRLSYLDALRGLAIILVVVSHVSNFDFGIKPYDSSWNHFICTFYLPLFFFISGFLSFKVWDSYKSIALSLWKKVLSLLLPLFVFFCIRGFVSGEINPLRNIFVYDGMIYWFLLVLFEIFVTYYSVCAIVRGSSSLMKLPYRLSLSVTLILFSVALVVCLVLLRDDESRFWNVACMENYTKYFQFFAFGIIAKAYNERFHSLLSNHFVRLFVVGLFFFLSIAIHLEPVKNNFWIYSAVHDELVRYLGILTMYILFYDNRHYFETKNRLSRAFVVVGRRSLDIYLLEGFFHPHLKDILNPVFASNYSIGLDITLSIIIAVLIIAICIGVSKILRTSELLGRLLFGSR